MRQLPTDGRPLPTAGIPAHLYQDWGRLCALVRDRLGDLQDHATVEDVVGALLRDVTLTETWGVRGVIAGEPDRVWERRDRKDAEECAKHFHDRLPNDLVEVVRVNRLTMPPEATHRYPPQETTG